MSDPSDLTHEVDREIARADKLLKVSEAAALSGVPKRTIWRWVEKHAITCVRLGPTQRIRIRQSIVQQWSRVA